MYFIRRDTTSSKFFHVNMATYTAQTTATTEMVTIAGISTACQLSISSNLNIIQKKISNCIIVPCHAKATRTFNTSAPNTKLALSGTTSTPPKRV